MVFDVKEDVKKKYICKESDNDIVAKIVKEHSKTTSPNLFTNNAFIPDFWVSTLFAQYDIKRKERIPTPSQPKKNNILLDERINIIIQAENKNIREINFDTAISLFK